MEENNKRIAKNTLYLYVRQLIIMVLSFFTTRVVLEKLGASDYGINNLVGGFVAGFTVLNNILSSGTQRFLSLYLGKGDESKLRDTFSTALVIHICISIVIAVALETGGLWFLHNKLNIEPARMYAATWVFQLAVIGTILGIIQTPFIAVVNAHEHFKIYAAFSIFDVIAKIAVIYFLLFIPGDKLIIYAILQLAVSIVGLTIYNLYCRRKFPECDWKLNIDKTLLKEMLTFSGWGALGHIITIVNTQGISIILNIFFNTVMNAARGLASTVNFVISNFVTGFQSAALPQLVKFYGAGEMDKFCRLVINVSQYTIFLLALFLVPTLLELDYVVDLWLGGEVPPYTCSFVKITLFCGIIYKSNVMVEYGLNAIGRVKEINMYSVPVYLIDLPLVYFTLKYSGSPIMAYWAASIPPLISFIINLKLLSHFTIFSGRKFFIKIVLKNTLLILVSAIIPFILQCFMQPGFVRFLAVCSVSLFSTITFLWIFAMNDAAKQMVKEKLKQICLSKQTYQQ